MRNLEQKGRYVNKCLDVGEGTVRKMGRRNVDVVTQDHVFRVSHLSLEVCTYIHMSAYVLDNLAPRVCARTAHQ
jgi:hypothetical protein